jgi:ubiquinone/menaquinone biosynthesis C-methylase UbiE
MTRRESDLSARQYDAMAADYARDNDDNAFNAGYERPATIALLGAVAGQRVLEVGCGAGPLTEWLVHQGATVTAIDVSPAMLDLARSRVGSGAAFHLADLSMPLSFAADHDFDIVVASLVLHYVEHWEPVLHEFRRVLTPHGKVVISTHHPAHDWQAHSPDNYFAVKQVSEVWEKGSGDYEVTFWRRPLTAMTSAFAAAGFLIERLVEPEPLPAVRERDPEADQLLRTEPGFLLFRLVAST